MGYRTVVILFNDRAGDWENDPELGRKIAVGMTGVRDTSPTSLADLNYGRVVEVAHADEQTLAVFDSYNMQAIAQGTWMQNETTTQAQEKLVRLAASKLGFKLVRTDPKANMGWTGSDDVAR